MTKNSTTGADASGEFQLAARIHAAVVQMQKPSMHSADHMLWLIQLGVSAIIYYAEGGATEAYCSRAVCQSFCPLRISRHSLKTKRWNLQNKQKLIFDQVWIERISVLKLSSRARRDLLTSMAVAGDLDSSEDKAVHRWLPYN